MGDEVLVVNNDNDFKPTPFVHTSGLDAKTRQV